MSRPVDNLVRVAPCELRAATEGGPVHMTGHFLVFNQWTEIHSWYEGDFMESVAPGSVSELVARGDRPRVLYDHGHDPMIGNKPLGTIRSWGEDDYGAPYDVEMFNAGYVNELLPALGHNEAGVSELGASFRFRVAGESWVENPKPSEYNPKGLPERTITKIDPVYEFGPVTFPAYGGATAGVRSGSDQFYERMLNDPKFVASLTKRLGPTIVGQLIDGCAGDAPSRGGHAGDAPGETSGSHPSVLRIRAAALAVPRR